MARGPSRGIAAPLAGAALMLVACSAGVAAPSTAPSTTSSTATSTVPTTTTSTTTTVPTTTIAAVPLPDIGAEVRVPDGDGLFPAVVLAHGGGWVIGTPALMRPLASFLTDSGFLTVNAPYRLSTSETPGFPGAVDDLACAVRLARSHPRSDGTVALVGHSAGAHLGAIVALSGDLYGSGCPIEGSGVPDLFVGLAGPYDIDRLGLVMLPFFGGGPVTAADAWAAGNPQRLVTGNPGLKALIMYGDLDGVVEPSFAIDFHEALLAAGVDSLIEIVEGADHNGVTAPSRVGDLITTWLLRDA